MILKRFVTVLATGYVLMFFSESMFWARFKPGDTFNDLAVTWLFYSLAAYAFLSTVAVFRVRGWWAVFLAGALFGWLVEGVIVQTAYDVFPVQISWTGLAWHALISVGVGWYLMPRALRSPRSAPAWLLSAVIGLFLGFWAISWWVEEPALLTSPADFAFFVALTTLLLAIGYTVSDWAARQGFAPSHLEQIVVALLFGLYFAFVTVPAAPLAVVLLPALLGVLFLGLWRHRQTTEAIHLLEPPVRPLNLLGLAVIPLTAVPFYTLAFVLELQLHTNQAVFLCTMPLGAILFVASVWKLVFKKPIPPVHPSPLQGS